MGCDVILAPAKWTKYTGDHGHWHTLVKSRAIDTQCVMIAPAQTGLHNKKLESYGHSMVVDSFGQIMCEIAPDKTNELLWVDIDLKKIKEDRKEMPMFHHRKDFVYNLTNKKLYDI